jgi:hypothetical protein
MIVEKANVRIEQLPRPTHFLTHLDLVLDLDDQLQDGKHLSPDLIHFLAVFVRLPNIKSAHRDVDGPGRKRLRAPADYDHQVLDELVLSVAFQVVGAIGYSCVRRRARKRWDKHEPEHKSCDD